MNTITLPINTMNILLNTTTNTLSHLNNQLNFNGCGIFDYSIFTFFFILFLINNWLCVCVCGGLIHYYTIECFEYVHDTYILIPICNWSEIIVESLNNIEEISFGVSESTEISIYSSVGSVLYYAVNK
jgi:hypothetical protein